jgi:hypothetical protein
LDNFYFYTILIWNNCPFIPHNIHVSILSSHPIIFSLALNNDRLLSPVYNPTQDEGLWIYSLIFCTSSQKFI